MNKLFSIVIPTMLVLMILFLLLAVKDKNSFRVSEQVIFSIKNKIYISKLNQPGKKLILEVKDTNYLEILDTYDGFQNLLLKSHKNNEDELLYYSKGKIKKIYTVFQNSNNNNFQPFLWNGTFGNSTKELFFTLVDRNKDKKYIIYLKKFDGLNSKILDIKNFEMEPSPNNLQYSENLNSLLLTASLSYLDKPNIMLYDLNKNKVEKLIEGFSPVFINRGKKFLYINEDSVLYEFNILNYNKTIKLNDVRYHNLYISSNNKYLLAVKDATEKESPEIAIISLLDGKRKIIDWKKFFNLKSYPEEFPYDIRWVK